MANIPTVAWDETSPSGSQAVSLGDDRIREMKTQVREVIGVDHKMASSSNDADGGKHNKVSLLEQADLGTGANGKPILGGQTVSSKPELVYTNEDDVDIQITSGTGINAAALTGVIAAANIAALATVFNLMMPVGHIYMGYLSTNPNTLFGIGTWALLGAGKVPICVDAADSDFDTAGKTGGAKTVTIGQTNLPSYNLTVTRYDGNGSGSTGVQGTTNGASAATQNISSGGSGTALNVMNPFVAVYIWRRTA